jgi:hypothetical protein
MSNTIKVSQLPAATSPLVGDEEVMIVQSGTSRRTTAADITSSVPINLATGVTGTLPLGHGGTGQVTASAGLNALLPSQGGHGGQVLTTNGSTPSWVSAGGATTGSWPANFVGFVTVPTTATIHYVIANGLCTLFLDVDVFDSPDGGGHLLIDNLPVAVTPASQRRAHCLVFNNSLLAVPGMGVVSSLGSIEFGALSFLAVPPVTAVDLTIELSAFTTVNDIGLGAGWTLVYPL